MSLDKNKYIFINETNVRIDDINFGNHLCHSKMINHIHNARVLFFKRHNLSEINCFGDGLVMLNVNVDYISQCFFDDTLEIGLYFDKAEKVKFSLSYDVFNKSSNKLAAKATTLMGCIDLKKGKLKRIPEDFVALVNSLNNK